MIVEYAAALSLLVWILLLFTRGRFWQIREADLKNPLPPSPPRVAIVVAARNESRVVGTAVSSLLRQDYPGVFQVFLGDDGSTDSTSEVALRAAREAGLEDRLTVIQARPAPAGWLGKPWALSEGLKAAADFRPGYLLFTDADIQHPPDELSRLVAKAESGGYDLVSLMVRLHAETFAEKSLMPAFVFFFFKIYPPDRVAKPGWPTAGAAGGCILLRSETLSRIGGISAIRGALIDDCALAKLVKRTGGKLWLGITSSAVSIRGYGSLAGLFQMISRNAFSLLHHSSLLLACSLLGMFATYLLPPLVILSFRPVAVLLGALAWGLMAIACAPIYRHYGLSALRGFLMPAVALFYTGASVHSAVRYWRGEGGEWKGRVQDQRTQAPEASHPTVIEEE
jgi:hopene-associated glycosyltransferase HpnB